MENQLELSLENLKTELTNRVKVPINSEMNSLTTVRCLAPSLFIRLFKTDIVGKTRRTSSSQIVPVIGQATR